MNTVLFESKYILLPLSALQTAFFRQHGCLANDANTKYNSRAAQMYREKIRQLGSTALARHGTDVSVGSWARVLG